MPGDFIGGKLTWLSQCLGAVRQQAMNWTNVDPDLIRQMATLGHNKLRGDINTNEEVHELFT